VTVAGRLLPSIRDCVRVVGKLEGGAENYNFAFGPGGCWKSSKESRIWHAWFPGRKRPVCHGERTVNGPPRPQPAPRTEPASAGLTSDRPVVYGRTTRPAGYQVLFLISINRGYKGTKSPPAARVPGADSPRGTAGITRGALPRTRN
jgi:hypothetical protein